MSLLYRCCLGLGGNLGWPLQEVVYIIGDDEGIVLSCHLQQLLPPSQTHCLGGWVGEGWYCVDDMLVRLGPGACWLQDSLACGFVFDFFDLLSKVLHVDTLVVFWDGAGLVLESGVLDDTKGQMVGWRDKPYFPGVRWIREDVEQHCKILRGSSRDGDAIVGNGMLGVEKGRQPGCKVLAQSGIAVVRAIFQGWKSARVVGEQFVSGCIKQLGWQQGMVWPAVWWWLAANDGEMVGRVRLKEGLVARVEL